MSWWCATCARKRGCPLYLRVQGRCPWYVPVRVDPGRALRELAERLDPKRGLRDLERKLDP